MTTKKLWLAAVGSILTGTSLCAQDAPTLPPVDVTAPRTTANQPIGPTNWGASFPATPGLPDNMAVTPTRGESPIRDFGGSVSIINQAQIANSEQPFVRDLLQTTPGLDVIQNGGPGRTSSVFLRGQSSRATKVLLDGIPINDPSSPQRTFDFGTFSTLEIERIEVLRGPQSTLYGSDAVGGVINIITKRGEGPARAWFTNQGGSYGTYENTANVSGGSKRTYFSMGVDWFDTQGFSVANNNYGRFFDTEKDPFRQLTWSTRFGWTPGEDFDVDVVLRYVHANSALDSFNQPPFTLITDDPLTSSTSDQFYGRIATRWAFLDGDWENKLAFNRMDISRDFDDPNSFFPPTRSLFKGNTNKVEYQANLRLAEDHKLTLGYDFYSENFESPPTTPNFVGQRDNAFYLQDQIGLFKRWYTTTGVRHDEYNLAGPATTWRVASIFHINETGSAVHGSYGTGFIAPSLFELFANSPPFVIGNPNLRPERAEGFEYGFTQEFFEKRLVVDATYFRIDNQDLIQYVFPTYANVNSARSSGVELITTLKLTDNTRIEANYTNTNTLDADLNRYLQLRPINKGSLTLNQKFLNGRGNWYLQMVAVGTRFDYAAPPELQRLQPYAVVNTAWSYRVRDNVQLLARIDNLFDANYEEIVGYNTARFSGYGGVKITFGGPRR